MQGLSFSFEMVKVEKKLCSEIMFMCKLGKIHKKPKWGKHVLSQYFCVDTTLRVPPLDSNHVTVEIWFSNLYSLLLFKVRKAIFLILLKTWNGGLRFTIS